MEWLGWVLSMVLNSAFPLWGGLGCVGSSTALVKYTEISRPLMEDWDASAIGETLENVKNVVELRKCREV